MKSIFGLFKRKDEKSDKIADFFYRASKEEKKAVFLEVAKRASEDQRELLKKYDEQLSHAR